MTNRINDKIDEIEEYLSDLDEFKPVSFELYFNNKEKKAVCEHYFERIIEAVEDLAFFVAKEKGVEISDEDKIFSILADREIISHDLARNLRSAKGMRNIIAHEYGEVDDEIVYQAVNEELGRDVREFLERIRGLR